MGKPRGARSLADQLADFEDPTPKGMKECFIYGSLMETFILTCYIDFDPEDIDNGAQSSDDEDRDQDEVNAGREHYEKVG
jgi:protein AATF/BFR2